MTYSRALLVEALVFHQRMDIGSCRCGWADLGKSHAEHIANIYEERLRQYQGSPS